MSMPFMAYSAAVESQTVQDLLPGTGSLGSVPMHHVRDPYSFPDGVQIWIYHIEGLQASRDQTATQGVLGRGSSSQEVRCVVV